MELYYVPYLIFCNLMVFYLKIMSVSLNIGLIEVIGYIAIFFPIPHIIIYVTQNEESLLNWLKREYF